MPKCPLCPKEYQSENDLNRHCKKIHGRTLKELQQEPLEQVELRKQQLRDYIQSKTKYSP